MSSIWEDKDFVVTHMEHMVREVEHLRTKIRESDTGHIHTAISVMEHRIKELREQL